MAQFNSAQESHNHSKQVLDLLYQYDSFLDSLEFIADFGCGNGLDSQWWATLMTRDDPPEPRNYIVYAVDKNIKKIDPEIKKQKNLFLFEEDFDTGNLILPRTVDFLWCHDSFQYVTNPLQTLKCWNEQMNVNGMLMLMFPQAQHYAYNRANNHSYSGCYFNYNIVNLMYMLAVNGFDCRDAYFKKEENNSWLCAAVYKSEIEPMDPKITSWYHLAELNLLNESVVKCINRYGYVRQEEILTVWLDKDFYFAKE